VAGNTKGGRISVPLTSWLTCLDWPVLQIKTKIVNCHTADSKPVKQEVNGTAILPTLVFPDIGIRKTTVGVQGGMRKGVGKGPDMIWLTKDKRSSLFRKGISDDEKSLYKMFRGSAPIGFSF
jgi:hypothetical protein